MNTSYIFLAPGFEEIEALTVLDVMRRAGMDVKTVSITDDYTVAGAHGAAVKADLLYDKTDFITPEWLIIPGGMPGARNLSEFAPLNTLLVNQAQSGKIAAICAAIKTIYKKLIEKIIFESLRIKICGNQSTIFKTVIFPVLGEFINAPLSSRSSAGLYSVRISFSKKSMFTALCVSILMTVSVYP